jgi:hypothetical protein
MTPNATMMRATGYESRNLHAQRALSSEIIGAFGPCPWT